MTTAFPGNLDAFTNPAPGDSTTTLSHAAQHDNANDSLLALQKVGVGPVWYTTKGNGCKVDGSTDDSAALANLSTTAASNVIRATAGTSVIGATISVGAAMSIPKGALLSPSAGVTLTLNGPLDAGPYQIFGGAGTVALGAGSCKRAYAEWWGATINTANDSAGANLAAFNAAIAACAAAKIPLHVTGGAGDTWVVKGQLDAQSNLYLEGDGATIKLDTGLSGAPHVLGGVAGLSNIHLRNLTFDGGATTYAETDRTHCLNLPNVAKCLIHDVTFQNARYDAFNISGTDITIHNNRLVNCGRHGGWVSTPSGVTTKRAKIVDNIVLDWARAGSSAGGSFGIVAQATAAATATGDSIEMCRNHVELQTGSAGAGSCIYAAGGTSNTDGHTYLLTNLKIDDNTCLNAGLGRAGYQGAAIEIAMNCPGFTCRGNTVKASVYDGISYGAGEGSGANDASVTGGIVGQNVVTGCLGAAGIEVEGANLSIIGNQCLGNSGHGIFVAGINSAISTFIAGTGGHTVAGNTCWGNGDNGICFVNCPNSSFTANVCANNGTSGPSFAGIKFQTNAADFEVTGCFFSGNQCFDTRSGVGRTQSYGIDTSASSGGSLCDGNRFGVNDCHNNVTNDILLCASPTTPDTLAPSNRKAVLAFAANPALDPASYDEFAMTLTGNVTTPIISRGGDGRVIRVALTQDATGGRTFAWPASFSFPAGTAPTLSGAGKTDIFGFQYDFAAGKWRQVSASLNMA